MEGYGSHRIQCNLKYTFSLIEGRDGKEEWIESQTSHGLVLRFCVGAVVVKFLFWAIHAFLLASVEFFVRKIVLLPHLQFISNKEENMMHTIALVEVGVDHHQIMHCYYC